MPSTTEVVLIAAPNGARRTPADHPNLPVTSDALAREAALCLAAGASMLHMHVRDAAGQHTLDPELYRQAIAAVREAAPGMIVQATSEAAGRYRPEEQIAAMRALAPEAMSVAVREIVPDAESENAAADFHAWAKAAGIHVQHIVYSPQEVKRFFDLKARDIIPAGRASLLFVLGKYIPPQDGQPEEVASFVSEIGGQDVDFTVCAFGRNEHACIAEAMRCGGHARVGFENNLLLPDGKPANHSADLVALAAAEARRIDRGIANPQAARELLHLDPEKTL